MARREAELGEALGLQAPVDADLPVRRHYVVEASEPVGPERSLGTTEYRKLPYKSYNRNEDH